MTDLVERLRAWANSDVDTSTDALLEQANMVEEAADEIERLQTALNYHVNELRGARREIDRLRGAA